MDTYSMAQVETLTGINAHTLRIWERRYQFIKAHRTDTNIRYYTGDQLKTLLNIAILIGNGYRVSKIDKMAADEIKTIVTELTATNTSSFDDDIHLLTVSMLSYDEQAFHKIFNRNILRNGLLTTVNSLIYPFLNQVGILWGTDKVSPPQEHFMSNLIRQKIIAATDSLPLPPQNAPSLLLFLLEGEDHELGLLLSSFIAKDLGWKVIYLGMRLQPNHVIEALIQTKTLHVFTMLTTPRSDNFVEELTRISQQINAPIRYAGSPIFETIANNQTAFNYLASPQEFINFLTQKHS